MFNDQQLLVMCNIIAAVESEDQIYHTRETATGYGAFAEAYENSEIEYAITLSRYQFYGIEGQKLLKMIYKKDKSLFTDELIDDLFNADWNKYDISRNSKKAKTIIKIISSDIGKECADELVGEQMQEYAKIAEQHGVTDVQAQALVANWIHQGGTGAFTRILAKTQKPYTLDNLYNASKSDTGSQVGAFKSRQTTVYNMIKQYMPITDKPDTQTKSASTPVTAQTILNIMRGWIGLNQYDKSHMQIVNIYNSHKPLARNYALTSTDSWCAATVSTAFIVANAVDLIGGTECGVERFIEDCFKPAGIWEEDGTITPEPGDIITFNWDQPYQPNNYFADHIGIVEYVDNDIINTIEGNAGGKVQRRTYPVGDGNIRGYAKPHYATSVGTNTQTNIILRKGDTGEAVTKLQTMLTACGYDCGSYGIDGEFGDDTLRALRSFQKASGLPMVDFYDDVTQSALEAAYDALVAPSDPPLTSAEETIPKKMYTVKSPFSYLRSGAAQKNPIIARLPVGTKVKPYKSKINKHDNLWYAVKVPSLDNIKGWIVATSLSEIKP